MIFQTPGWGHEIVEWVGISTTVILTFWGFKISAQRDTQQRHEENKKNQEKLLQELQAEREFLPQHWHGEIGECKPLTTDGIIRKPKNGH